MTRILALWFAIALVTVAFCALIHGAYAGEDPHGVTTTFRDRSGNVTGYSHTDVNGNTTFRDRGRNVVGTARSK
jgi:hypothetical protein